MLELEIWILVVLLFFSAFFSGIETAFMSLSMVKVLALVKKKRKGAETLHRLKENPHRLIITILIGNNLVNVGAASLATVVFTDLFGSSGIGIATGVMTFLILVFGEITPKTLATQHAEKISLFVARPIELLSYLLLPLVIVFEVISKGVSRLFGTKEEKLSEEEIRTIVTMGRAEGILGKEAAEMMHNVLEFEDTKVVDIMTPKDKIDMINGNLTLKKVIDFVVRSPYSRFPVFIKNKDKISGILDVDDVLKQAKNRKLDIKVKKIVRKIFFVPESKEIDDLLVEFEGKHVPMAMVVDEYGNVSGLVTVEDILEEIVGDIFDKSRKKSKHIRKVSDKLIKVDARASIEELNRTLHLDLEEKHFDTIAGFVEGRLKKIPKKGEEVKLKKMTIVVDKVSKQGIKSVKIIRH
ncbi:MAG: HlyC/CorC family transporter [Nanoarchaeota archaeon]|nr:HlyC/CorC family transporter [Nanoarchaeota archaeon]